jgi:hypothetical protein
MNFAIIDHPFCLTAIFHAMVGDRHCSACHPFLAACESSDAFLDGLRGHCLTMAGSMVTTSILFPTVPCRTALRRYFPFLTVF